MPQWQPIESVWAIAKGNVKRNYRHVDQTYDKMRKDLVVGFNGDKKTGYKGVTPKRVLELTKSCEKDMLQWLNKNQNLNLTDLKDYQPSQVIDHAIQPEEFQFDNCDEIGPGIFDADSEEEN